MNTHPPAGFVSVYKASTSAIHSIQSVIGVVSDAGFEPSVTRTGDHMITFKIVDHEYILQHGNAQGIRLRIFRRDLSQLPSASLGDIVCVTQAKIMEVAGARVLISSFQTRMTVFPFATIPDAAFDVSVAGGKVAIQSTAYLAPGQPSLEEQMYVIHLKKKMEGYLPSPDMAGAPMNAPTGPRALQQPGPAGPSRNVPTVPRAVGPAVSNADLPDPRGGRAPKPQGRGRELVVIKDALPETFYDTIVEIVKIFSSQYGYTDLYVTDYTTNRLLFDYPSPEEEAAAGREGDVFNYAAPKKREWLVPWGQMVLKIEVREPHTSFLQSCKEKDLIHIRNLRFKIGHDNKLEGNLWPDKLYPDKVLISRASASTSDHAQALLARHEKYWQKYQHLVPSKDAMPEKRKKSSKEKKKDIKKAKLKNDGIITSVAAAPLDNTAASVRCTHMQVPLSSISDTLAFTSTRYDPRSRTEHRLPFVNQNRRVRVRIRDFYPEQLEDFASRREEDSQSDPELDRCLSGYTPTSRPSDWKFDFFLLAEDARANSAEPSAMWLHLGNKAAEYLLDMSGTDLHNNTASLVQMREKLFLLWGNLEEIKSESVPSDTKPSSPAFDCCIAEFGQRLDADDTNRDLYPDGWIRLFDMFETKIH